jgi:hypothetical protein
MKMFHYFINMFKISAGGVVKQGQSLCECGGVTCGIAQWYSARPWVWTLEHTHTHTQGQMNTKVNDSFITEHCAFPV